MLNDVRNKSGAIVDEVLDSVTNLLRSRKFTLAVAGFVAAIVGVPTEALVPLVAAVLVEGAADIKGR